MCDKYSCRTYFSQRYCIDYPETDPVENTIFFGKKFCGKKLIGGSNYKSLKLVKPD